MTAVHERRSTDTVLWRPTERLRWAQERARSAGVVASPEVMGTCRLTRHSFARSMLRHAGDRRWQVTRERWEMDVGGRGEAVYRVDAEGIQLRFVIFSTTIGDDQRTDRVIAASWDVTAALIEGDLPDERMAFLRENVPGQETGRADVGSLVWTRANRSQRFFDYTVDRLAAGLQPEPEVLGDAAYILRSTAFYSNGKFGLRDFEGLPVQHPLAVPYRAQMLAAWLLRELSYDLVEHCARQRSTHAVALSGQWRRFLGLGNATGLGMVPYIVNHPRVLDAWCALRELPLAYALAQSTEPDDGRVSRLAGLLSRARHYFAERGGLATDPYLSGPDLADHLATLRGLLEQYQDSGQIAGHSTTFAWRALHDAADHVHPEARGVLESLLVELYDELDDDIELMLRCDESLGLRAEQSCQALLELIESGYAWVDHFDFDDPEQSYYFWFVSANSEEPRRGRRGHDPGEQVEQPVDIARAVSALRRDLRAADRATSVAEFLLSAPWHRGAVCRVQSLATVPWAETQANLLARDFLPLHLQRFQLAVYGMDNYSPQSTDWLRVTLFSGAPRAADIAAGVNDDDWLFTRKPEGEHT
ncbi:hypothetical protein GIY23_12235 [Allosaccharopolyspora coralli]|uniref:Uncharacterized protein n=1 Tax=Allosaccharopolyspora coralli TaxID=2665642 RepID=A0A5Q3Q6U5_9PSEU|nr:hypothetical protein [Allosaccharopolyspora coralli]QGK70192.1 hypothetical protein GIY23_12235 [Allosaccharopolyspora coralli]